jgi:hypothetical protein
MCRSESNWTQGRVRSRRTEAGTGTRIGIGGGDPGTAVRKPGVGESAREPPRPRPRSFGGEGLGHGCAGWGATE